jgi:hypothetical protein
VITRTLIAEYVSALGSKIHFSTKCELILLHGSKLQPRLGRKFKSVDAQLHKAADCSLSQAAWAGPEEGRAGQRLLADRAVAYAPRC